MSHETQKIERRGCRWGQRRHGFSYLPEYRAWQQMRLRCTDPEHAAWDDYGGRGVTVCVEWVEDVAAFIAHIGRKPSRQHELDRIDNDKGYEPGNVRWVLRPENARNRRSTRWLDAHGERLPAITWAERTGIPVQTIYTRLKLGWTDERAVTEPARAWVTGRTVEIDGVTRSVKELGPIVAARIRKGWDPVAAATTPVVRGERFDLDGEMLTLVELSRRSGLARRTIRDRIERGMSVRDAISAPRACSGPTKRAA